MKAVPQIFLSYVRVDKQRVEDLYRELSTVGFKPWMDKQDVLGGELWKAKIHKAIRDSAFFLACLSTHSLNKRGFLQKEIKNALDIWQEKLPDDIYLIPVRLEECEVPEALGDFQWVNLFEPDGWMKLLKAIQVGLERREFGNLIPAVSSSFVVAQASDRTSPETLAPTLEDRQRKLAEIPSLLMDLTTELPVASFPEELSSFIGRVEPKAWESLDEEARRFLITLGTKLEPFVQVVPPTPVPLVIGFESLALGSLGESFSEICRRFANLDAGLLRLLMTLAAMKTSAMFRINAAQDGNAGVRHLLFTLNLDPEMLDSRHIEDFLERYHYDWRGNVLFEVNEKTTLQNLRRLKELQVDFNLRYCADDFNDWDPRVKEALQDRVEMSKVDYKTFREAMAVRGDNPTAAINRIAAHRIPGKPLIVEGIENRNYLRFLDEHWPFDSYGSLFGQGYIIQPGHPWDAWTIDLRDFGLPGGHFLTNVPQIQGPKIIS